MNSFFDRGDVTRMPRAGLEAHAKALEAQLQYEQRKRQEQHSQFCKQKKALHEITNMAHPLHPEIFKVAMKGLGLGDVASHIQGKNNETA